MKIGPSIPPLQLPKIQGPAKYKQEKWTPRQPGAKELPLATLQRDLLAQAKKVAKTVEAAPAEMQKTLAAGAKSASASHAGAGEVGDGAPLVMMRAQGKRKRARSRVEQWVDQAEPRIEAMRQEFDDMLDIIRRLVAERLRGSCVF